MVRTHNQTIIMFSNDYDSQVSLVKLIEDNYKLIKCQYDVSSYNSIEAYKSSVTVFVFDKFSDDFNTSWLLNRISEQELLETVPIAFTSFEAYTEFNKLGYENLASDIISDSISEELVLKRLSNLVSMHKLKTQIGNLTHIHSKRLMMQASKLREQTQKMHKLNFDLIELLVAAIESRDVESGQHIKRIRYFVKTLLEVVATECPEYNLTEEQIEIISLASAVHDIGKISIPDAILLKPARLTREEFELMKTHTTKGVRLLNMLDGIGDNVYFQYCREICLNHHEKWDGKGYPNGLKGDEIPISAQVVSIADCYDALTSDRPYKHALSHEEAVNLIKTGACGAFSSQIMKCFEWCLADYKKIEEEFKSDPVTLELEDKVMGNIDLVTDKVTELKDDNSLSPVITKYAQTITNSYDVIFEADFENDDFTLHKGNWAKLFGYLPRNISEALAQITETCHKDDLPSFSRSFTVEEFCELAKKGYKKTRAEFRIITKSKQEFLVAGSVTFITDKNRDLTGICASFNGYDSSIFVKETKPKFKTHDLLTGLPVEDEMRKDVEAYLYEAKKDTVCFMLYIDVDGMTCINNTAGYEFGNNIIKSMAERITEFTKDKDCFTCSLSGDKFCIFLKNVKRKLDAVLFVENLHKNLREEYKTATGTDTITATIGVSRYPDDGLSYRELLNQASYASDISKLNGSDMYTFYNSSIGNYKYFEETLFYDVQIIEDDSTKSAERFIPVFDKKSDTLVCYDYLPFSVLGDMLPIPSDVFRDMFTLVKNKKKASIIQIKKLINIADELIKKTGVSPVLSTFTLFSVSDIPAILQQLSVFYDAYPQACGYICLCLPQQFLKNISWRNLKAFADSVRMFGFSLGAYLVCDKYLDMLCMGEGLFDRIVLAGEFAEKAFTGFYPPEFLSDTIKNLSYYTPIITIPDELAEINAETLYSYDCMSFSVYEPIIAGTDDLFAHFNKQYTEHEQQKREVETASIINPVSFVFALNKSNCLIIQQDFITGGITYSNNVKRVLGYSLNDFISKKRLDFGKFIHKDDVEAITTSYAKSKGMNCNAFFSARVLVSSECEQEYVKFNFSFLPTVDNKDIVTMLQILFSPEC